MRYIYPLNWPEWERFALDDAVTIVGVIAISGLPFFGCLTRTGNSATQRNASVGHRRKMRAGEQLTRRATARAGLSHLTATRRPTPAARGVGRSFRANAPARP
jgi:hypothetical protein